jgi:hypothetical protein
MPRRFFRTAAIYAVITLVTLVVADIALIALGLFPPRLTPGDAELGWVSAKPTGAMQTVACMEFSTGERHRFLRNEDGVRSDHPADSLRADTAQFTIAVGGDSQTEICVPNAEAHFGVLERALREDGIRASVVANGAGKYSPLQAYLALRRPIADYSADAIVINLYTGNDVYDMLRVDDRPHFVATDSGYRVAAPIWYQEDPPGTVRRSRVLWALRQLAQATGLRNVALRLWYLRDTAREQGAGIGKVLGYMNDLRHSASSELGYPAALSAQMLNQQLFFHHFAGSRDESLRRVRALLEMIRRDHPGRLLVLSPLPSYQLVARERVDSAMLRVLTRLPVTNESGIALENGLYENLRTFAAETGWLFVDVLGPLRAYEGSAPLYNGYDYHVLPPASRIIGETQARAIRARLRAGARGIPAGR